MVENHSIIISLVMIGNQNKFINKKMMKMENEKYNIQINTKYKKSMVNAIDKAIELHDCFKNKSQFIRHCVNEGLKKLGLL